VPDGFTLARLAVGLLGVAALGVGLHAAWVSSSASTALIVGGVLVALALFLNPRLQELSGRFKDAAFTYRLSEISETLEEVAAVGAEPHDPAIELSTVRRQIRALAEQLESETQDWAGPLSERAERARKAWMGRWQGWAKQGAVRSMTAEPPRFTYDVVRHNGHVRFSMHHSGWLHDWRLRCTAVAPNGEVASRIFFGQTGGGTFTFVARYPDDFPGAPRVQSGEYEFRWSRVGESGATAPVAIDRVIVAAELLSSNGGPSHSRLDPQRTIQAP